MSIHRLIFCPALLLGSLFVACSGQTEDDLSGAAAGAAGKAGGPGPGGASGSSAGSGASGSGAGGAAGETTCSKLWAQIATFYPDAGPLADCGSDPVKQSIFKLDGLSIDNNGATMHPCIEARCDDKYAYVATNTLPHYDFVQTTPNPLVEAPQILRVPRSISPVASAAGADSVEQLDGCVEAYNQHLSDPSSATAREPSHLCSYGQGDSAYLTETIGGKKVTYRKINCLGTVAFLINGVVVAGPNEGPDPDPFGNPIFFFPEKAGETYGGTGTAALDLCGGHTANSMHYHGVNPSCFERNAEGAPAKSYAAAASTWNFKEAIDGACSAESPVVGFSPDGHPIKGPCVCIKRNADGSCASVKRARSGWSYQGLKAWSGSPGADPDASGALAHEGQECAADAECCQGVSGKCHFKCSRSVFEDAAAPGGTSEARRCVMLDYSWCTHRYADRSAADTSAASFVYLDRCNGFDGPDGYAYHTTGSFPFIVGCYRDEPTTLGNSTGGPMGGGPMGGGPMGGGPMGGGPMGGGGMAACQPGQTSMCCGDGVCEGPENAQMCPQDCK